MILIHLPKNRFKIQYLKLPSNDCPMTGCHVILTVPWEDKVKKTSPSARFL